MTFIYSPKTYIQMGTFPPLCAPQSVWTEYLRLWEIEKERQKAEDVARWGDRP